MESNWIYIGIFLDEKSKRLLRKLYPIPEGWSEYYDHMTVVYNDQSDVAKAVKSINEKNLSKKFRLKIEGPGISDKAFAVRVDLPEGVVCANKIAHITLGTSSIGSAVDSNYITNWSKTYKDMYVTGKMEVYKPNTNILGTPVIDEANIY